MTTEENFLDFKCPYCDEDVSFPRDSLGKVHECPNCNESLILPGKPGDPGLKIPLPITTPRLIVRRVATADWKDLLEFLSDEDLFRYEERGPMDDERIIRWLEADQHVKLTTPNATFCLGLAPRPGDKVGGIIYLDFTDESHLQARLRVYLSRNLQRQGLGTEAVNSILGFCFESVGLHRIFASCDSRNVAAQRLLEKVGMKREGQFRKDQFVNGEWVDTLWSAILDEDYFHFKNVPPPRGPS